MASSFIQKFFWGSQLKKDQVGIFCLVKYDVVVEVRLCSPTTTATWQHPRWSIALFSFLLERLHLYYCSRIEHTYLPYNTASNKSNRSFTSSTAVWKKCCIAIRPFWLLLNRKNYSYHQNSFLMMKEKNQSPDFNLWFFADITTYRLLIGYWGLNSCNFESVVAK